MNKVLILRGLPGCGKTTYATRKEAAYADSDLFARAESVSADDYFVVNNKYVFDPRNIGAAHAYCFSKFLRLLHNWTSNKTPSLLIVDNTNIAAYEAAPYIQAANAYGWEHEIVTLWCNPVLAARRNVHGVPAAKVLMMYQSLLIERLPPFWNHQVLLGEEE